MINCRAITLTLASLCLLVINGSASIDLGQNTKTIIRRLTLSKEPVEISFNLQGHPAKVSYVRAEEGIRAEEFDGQPDWLKDLTVNIRNTSGQTITYLELDLHFPEVARNGRTALHQIFVGVDPDRKFQRAELRLVPNETIEIPLVAINEDIRTLVGSVGDVSPESVTKLWVEFHSALFADGTLFEAGTLYRRNPNPNDKSKWIPM